MQIIPIKSSLPANCSFDTNAWEILAKQWFPVAITADIADTPKSTMLLDEPLVIYRIKGKIVIAKDSCPHRGVPLSLGKQNADGLECAYHGLQFGEDGRCNKVPCSPGMKIPEKLHLTTYPAIERYGLIWTCLQPAVESLDDLAVDTIPKMPFWDDPAFQQIVCPEFDIAGFAGRQVEGFLDVAHFGYIHTATFSDPKNTEVPLYATTEIPNGFSAEYKSFIGNYPIGVDSFGKEGFEWLRHFEAHLPFTATLTVHFPDEGKLVIMNAASPVSALKTRLFAPIARNFDKDIPIEKVHEFNLRVFEEDRLMVESQRPQSLPLDPAMEAHTPADRSSIVYRKGLRAMGFDRFFAS